jgi:hypothetical protein
LGVQIVDALTQFAPPLAVTGAVDDERPRLRRYARRVLCVVRVCETRVARVMRTMQAIARAAIEDDSVCTALVQHGALKILTDAERYH